MTGRDRVIGHGKKGMQKVYDQHARADEMRMAMLMWGEELARIVSWEPTLDRPLLEAPAEGLTGMVGA